MVKRRPRSTAYTAVVVTLVLIIQLMQVTGVVNAR